MEDKLATSFDLPGSIQSLDDIQAQRPPVRPHLYGWHSSRKTASDKVPDMKKSKMDITSRPARKAKLAEIVTSPPGQSTDCEDTPLPSSGRNEKLHTQNCTCPEQHDCDPSSMVWDDGNDQMECCMYKQVFRECLISQRPHQQFG